MPIAWTTLDVQPSTSGTATTVTTSMNVGTLSASDLLIVLLACVCNDGNSWGITAGGNTMSKSAQNVASVSQHQAAIFQITGLTLSGPQSFVWTTPFSTFCSATFACGKLTGYTSTTATATGAGDTNNATVFHLTSTPNVPNTGYGLYVASFAGTNGGTGGISSIGTDATFLAQFGISVLGPITNWDPTVTLNGSSQGGATAAVWQGPAAVTAPGAVDASGGGAIFKLRRPGWPRAAAAPAYARKNGILVPSREIIRPRLVGWRRPLAA